MVLPEVSNTVLLNGSPRGRESNSRLILSWIACGLSGKTPERFNPGDKVSKRDYAGFPVLDLARTNDVPAQIAACKQATFIILVFPLYTDSVPGIVKNFLEQLAATLTTTEFAAKKLAIAIQSGFPEGIHTENTAHWCARLCERLCCGNAGIIHLGDMEGIRIMPEAMTKKIRLGFLQAGRELASSGAISTATSTLLTGDRLLSAKKQRILRFFKALGLTNLYWNMNLKKHKAFSQRFYAPYGEAYKG